MEVPDRQCPHFIHAAFVDLEGGCHPAAAGALLPPPAEGAQLRHAFGTQQLSFHYSKQRRLHPLHRLGEVRGTLLTAVTTKLSRVRHPLVGKGCRAASFRVGEDAGTTEQSTPAFPAPVENLCVWSLTYTGWINSKDLSRQVLKFGVSLREHLQPVPLVEGAAAVHGAAHGLVELQLRLETRVHLGVGFGGPDGGVGLLPAESLRLHEVGGHHGHAAAHPGLAADEGGAAARPCGADEGSAVIQAAQQVGVRLVPRPYVHGPYPRHGRWLLRVHRQHRHHPRRRQRLRGRARFRAAQVEPR